MFADKTSNDEFWCPLGDSPHFEADRRVGLSMTPAEWAALSRLAMGEWLPDAQIDRLQALGLVERVFGHALLTRLGRTTLGLPQ